MFGLVQFISLCMGAVIFFPDDVDFVLDFWGKAAQTESRPVHWPSRQTTPVQCHSHNDYGKKQPLYGAINYGCIGVEADVWLFDEDLYVGHTTSSLTPDRTLQSLYINPLREMLDKKNPSAVQNGRNKLNGVYDSDPHQALILLIDFKSSGPLLWPHVEKQLTPLREKNYLTYWDGTDVIEGPVTVVGSGNTPFDLLTANTTYRDIFFDAPLDQLDKLSAKDKRQTAQLHFTGDEDSFQTRLFGRSLLNYFTRSSPDKGQGHSFADASADIPPYSAANSYYASVSFRKTILNGVPFFHRPYLSQAQLNLIRTQIQDAHNAGLKVRYWGIPSFPRKTKNYVSEILVREGADMLNVDELQGRDWRGTRGRGWISLF